MNKLHAALLATCLLGAAGARAADEMKKDTMGKDDTTMKQDAMSKDGMMKKDAMGKDRMMKKDSMAKGGMAKKHGTGMKNDEPAMHNEGPTREEMKR